MCKLAILINIIILECHHSCSTCKTTDINCESCSSIWHRNINITDNTCPCDNGFYDDSINSECKICSSKCVTCETFPTNC